MYRPENSPALVQLEPSRRTRAPAPPCPEKVLIVTGGLLSVSDRSLASVLRRQALAIRSSSAAWLDIQVKLFGLEEMLLMGRHRKSASYRRSPAHGAVEHFFDNIEELESPELTEVALMTLLKEQGMSYEATTYAEICSDAAVRERLLGECSCVFLSTTLLRDMSELDPLIRMLKRPHNHLVAGGALAGILHAEWPGHPDLEILAIGYGELLVASLASWIRSGYAEFETPPTGRIELKRGTTCLYSGVPNSKHLDGLSTPDWSLASQYHGTKYRLVHYESVRGCPYRCGFCNYPYLFDDTKFRYKSAERIADDWERYVAQGAEYISCLDSLFTMPKQRLVKLCHLLLERNIQVKWICYARADDLADLETARLMRRAGCVWVHIGIESGDQGQLDRMNKRCSVEKNGRALRNCREVGITSLVTVILGYPGETEASIRRTLDFLRDNPPDLCYPAPFNARVEHVPILSEESRARYGITTANDGRSSQPYWSHDTMACHEAGHWYHWFHQKLMEQRIALSGALFFRGLLHFEPEDRQHLLDFQHDVWASSPGLRRIFARVHRWVARQLERDVERTVGAATQPTGGKA